MKLDRTRLKEIMAPFVSNISDEILDAEEAGLLRTLDWKIVIPSIESWLSTYCARLNLLTQRLLVPSIAWVWMKAISNANILIWHSPASPKLPPRRQANGLLGLGLVSARLLPPDAIATKNLCPVLWEQVCLQMKGTMSQQESVSSCALPDSHASRILKWLCVSVRTDLKNLRQDCEDVALHLQGALAGDRGAFLHE